MKTEVSTPQGTFMFVPALPEKECLLKHFWAEAKIYLHSQRFKDYFLKEVFGEMTLETRILNPEFHPDENIGIILESGIIPYYIHSLRIQDIIKEDKEVIIQAHIADRSILNIAKRMASMNAEAWSLRYSLIKDKKVMERKHVHSYEDFSTEHSSAPPLNE